MATCGHRVAAGQVASSSCRLPVARPARVHMGRREVAARSTAPSFERNLMGENFGARDPFPGEIASNFGEKVLGNYNTEHIIKPPDAMGKVLGLTARACTPAQQAQLLDEQLVERYRQQVPGWKIVSGAAGARSIRQEWSCRDGDAAQQLLARIQGVAAAKGHALSSSDAVSATAVVELTTPAAGGLTENDFIVAACVNELDVSDLLAKRKQRFWA